MTPPSQFRFVISGDLEDFAAFCAIIRGDDLEDEAKLAAITARLKRHTEKLAKAVSDADNPPHP